MIERTPKEDLKHGLEGEDLAVVSRVDSLLGLPDKLNCLDGVIEGLADLCLDLRTEGWTEAADDIDRFCEISRFFLEDQSRKRRLKLINTSREIRDSFHGILSTHPFYPIFFYQCENPDLRPAYRRLLKLMLTSRTREVKTRNRARFEELDKRELNTRYYTCLLVRKLRKDTPESGALLQRIDRFKHPQGLLIWVDQECPMRPPLSTATYKEVRQLSHFLADCHGLKSVVEERVETRSPAKSTRKTNRANLRLGGGRKQRTNAEPTDEVEKQDTGMELRRLAEDVPEAARKDLGDAGLLAAEFHQDTEHWLGILHSDDLDPEDEEGTDDADSSVNRGEIETGLPRYAKYFTAAKNKAMKFAFDNQRTATRWSRPTMAEYAELVSAVEERFAEASRKADDIHEQQSKRAEAARVRDLCFKLGLMVVLGRSFESIHDLKVLESEADWDPEKMEVAFLKRERRWLLSTTQLGYKTAPSSEELLWYRHTKARVLLPDLFGFGKTVLKKEREKKEREKKEKEKAESSGQEKQPQGRQPKSQERHFEDHLEGRREPGGRFTWKLDTIANLLGDWLEVHESPTLVGLLVPRLGSHVATQLFYTAVEAPELEKAYTRAWRAVIPHLQAEGVRIGKDSDSLLFSQSQDIEDWPAPMDAGVYVGSPRVATPLYFQQLAGSLIESVRTKSSSTELIDLHNEYTAYTWLFLAMATASRGVHHPFENLDIAVEVGALHMHDKDYESGGQARVAFLPDSLINHLERYLQWCRRVLQVMARVESETKTGFNRMRVDSKRKTLQPISDDTGYPALGSLFFLDENWHPEPATPMSVKSQLGDRHPLPINAQRHVLRSYLMEQQCPEAVIDAFMGHWDRGQEPWASYSVMDPNDYRKQLLHYLEPLLSQLGFEPLAPDHG